MGVAYSHLRERQKALEYYRKALAMHRELANAKGEGSTLNNIGEVYGDLGENQQSLDYYDQALKVWQAINNRAEEAKTMTNIGAVYGQIGDYQKALDYYNRALPIQEEIGDRDGEAATLNNMGAAHYSFGEPHRALEQFSRTLPLVRQAGDRRREAYTLSNIGLMQASIGEYQKALDSYEDALSLLRVIGDKYGEATTLNNIGLAYLNLGEYQNARNYYEQALALILKIGDRYGEATLRNGLGVTYSRTGAMQEALDAFTRALPLRRAISDRDGEAHTLYNIGGIYDLQKERNKATDYYNQALVLWRGIGSRNGEASALTSLGGVYIDGGDKDKAFEALNKALTLRRGVGDRGGEAATLYEIARLERSRNNLNEARAQIESAINIIESIRQKLISQQLRASYLATVQKYYELYINILQRMHVVEPAKGFDAQALQASERARARSLLDLLIESHADIREGVDPELLRREREMQQRLNAKAERQLRMLSGKHTEEQAQAAAKELETLTAEYRDLEAQVRLRSPRYAALTQPQPLSLQEIQTQVLDPETLLLEYSLGEEQSYVWAVTRTTIKSYELPKRSEIEDAARNLYALFTSRQRPAAEVPGERGLGLEAPAKAITAAADRLSKMVLAPVAPQLGRKRLVIVADDALQYLPFAALPSPANRARPLILDHEVVNLPSASTLAVLRREVSGRAPATKALAVLADPVFDADDVRVGNKRSNESAIKPTNSATRGIGLLQTSAKESGLAEGLKIPRLPGTRQEAEAILRLARLSDNKNALDFEASRATIFSPDLANYRYLHVASHGFLNSTHPELSGIVLSLVDDHGNAQDGFLRAHEVFNLRIAPEVVVLSACQTGLGKEVRGEGLIGLTRAFMYAGAPRVVVSLWSVSDVGTAELMQRFYRGVLVTKLRPSAALRQAQVSMWREKRWHEPFYWAPFVLQGEWR
jgi:CHAT domain-containing protein/Tfp pilus assembly protein PilF